jgi:hypothetical protein
LYPNTAWLIRLDCVITTAIERIESTEEGQAFLSSFYSDEEYTIFAPTDQAFKGYGLDSSNVRKENPYWLQDVLKYHVSRYRSGRKGSRLIRTNLDGLAENKITTGKTRITQLPAPRSHTILKTLYHNYTSVAPDATLTQTYGSLPGGDTQVLVLEKDVGDAGNALVRGDTWNVTTVDRGVDWENLLIQKVDRVSPIRCRLLSIVLLHPRKPEVQLTHHSLLDIISRPIALDHSLPIPISNNPFRTTHLHNPRRPNSLSIAHQPPRRADCFQQRLGDHGVLARG